MNTAKSLICIFAATMILAAPAWAGGAGNAATSGGPSQESPWTDLAWKVHSKRDRHPAAAAPFIFLGRAWETFLHSPQILSETMQGDRPLVGKNGVLAPRETPVEERIVSPDE